MSTLIEKVSNFSKLIRQTIGSALSSVHAGDDKMTSRQHPSIGSLSISSPGFSNGLAIPRRFTPQGENISPELTWSGVPLEAKELVLIVEDPDAPMTSPFVHWIIRGLDPTVGGLSQGLGKTVQLADLSGAVQGKTTRKKSAGMAPNRRWGTGFITIIFSCSRWTSV